MDWLTFTVRMTEVLIWPVVLGVLVICAYKLRTEGALSFATMLNRLRELTVGSFKVVLAETGTGMPVIKEGLDVDASGTFYKKYSNGVIVQRIKMKIAPTNLHIFAFPIAFPNEVFSVQFVNHCNFPLSRLSVYGCDIDASTLTDIVTVELIVTGM